MSNDLSSFWSWNLNRFFFFFQLINCFFLFLYEKEKKFYISPHMIRFLHFLESFLIFTWTCLNFITLFKTFSIKSFQKKKKNYCFDSCNWFISGRVIWCHNFTSSFPLSIIDSIILSFDSKFFQKWVLAISEFIINSWESSFC